MVPMLPWPSWAQSSAHISLGVNGKCPGEEKEEEEEEGRSDLAMTSHGFTLALFTVISYSSDRHLRREARKKPCSSGSPSIEYTFSMAYFPFLFFPTRCLTQYVLINAKKGKIHALQH